MARQDDEYKIVRDTQAAVDAVGSKFAATLGIAKRTEEINTYYGQLGSERPVVPPQVVAAGHKAITTATTEIGEGAIEIVVHEVPEKDLPENWPVNKRWANGQRRAPISTDLTFTEEERLFMAKFDKSSSLDDSTPEPEVPTARRWFADRDLPF